MPKISTKTKIEKLKESLSVLCESLPEEEKKLALDILDTYCWYSIQVKELTDLIDKQGSFIEVEKGAANNRHAVIVEHPAINTLNKMAAKKNEYYKTLIKKLPDSAQYEDDDLDLFLKGE